MTTKKWKKFEEDLQDHLKELQRRKPIIYHRFYDTASTQGGYLPNQPGDFMAVHDGHAVLIEAKTSTRFDSFRSCAADLIDPGQLGMHRKWLRAGAMCLFVFQGKDGAHEIWPSSHVVEQRSLGRPLSPVYCAHFQSKPNLMTELTRLILQ